MTLEHHPIPGEPKGVFEARVNRDQRVAQMAVLFWGMFSEQVGEQMLQQLGLNSGNLDGSLGVGVLDANLPFVHEFTRLYGESDIKAQVPEFVRGVVEMAEQAARNVDKKGGGQ